LYWIVVELELFLSVEASIFQQIFKDLLGKDLSLKSATTVKYQLVAQLADLYIYLRAELDTTY
jgi:hypothetical protein